MLRVVRVEVVRVIQDDDRQVLRVESLNVCKVVIYLRGVGGVIDRALVGIVLRIGTRGSFPLIAAHTVGQQICMAALRGINPCVREESTADRSVQDHGLLDSLRVGGKVSSDSLTRNRLEVHVEPKV